MSATRCGLRNRFKALGDFWSDYSAVYRKSNFNRDRYGHAEIFHRTSPAQDAFPIPDRWEGRRLSGSCDRAWEDQVRNCSQNSIIPELIAQSRGNGCSGSHRPSRYVKLIRIENIFRTWRHVAVSSFAGFVKHVFSVGTIVIVPGTMLQHPTVAVAGACGVIVPNRPAVDGRGADCR